jgi:hypothetical protein
MVHNDELMPRQVKKFRETIFVTVPDPKVTPQGSVSQCNADLFRSDRQLGCQGISFNFWKHSTEPSEGMSFVNPVSF